MYQNIINDWKCWDRTCPSGTRRDSHRLDDGCRGYYGIREMVQDLIWLSANDIWLQFTLQISTVSKHRLGNFNMATLITRSRTWKTSSLSLSVSPQLGILLFIQIGCGLKITLINMIKYSKTLAAVTSAGITIDRSVPRKIRCQMRERAAQVRVTVLLTKM